MVQLTILIIIAMMLIIIDSVDNSILFLFAFMLFILIKWKI